MDHPHVARVLDVGSTEDGRPWFAIELVPGVSLTAYCDQHRLTTRQRLELGLDACQAVQHAHLKGVVHRDLKPSNILVAEREGVPDVKVIDFGIAKAVGSSLPDSEVETQAGYVVGTPAYMSPEHAEGSPAPRTAASASRRQLMVSTRSRSQPAPASERACLSCSPASSESGGTRSGL
jgi:serine/threonine protein kinase